MPTATLLQFMRLGEADDQTSLAAIAMDPIPELEGYTPSRKGSGQSSEIGLPYSPRGYESDSDDRHSRRSSWIETDDSKPIPWGASSPAHSPRPSLDLDSFQRRGSIKGHCRSASASSSLASASRRGSLSVDALPLADSTTLPPLTPATLRSSATSTPSAPHSAVTAAPPSANSSASSVNLSHRSRVSLDAASPVIDGGGSSSHTMPDTPAVQTLAGVKAVRPVRPPTIVALSTTPEGGSYESRTTASRVAQPSADDDDELDEHVEPDEDEAAEINQYSALHRNVVDVTLRSTPGVVGLGEGWAGGLQPKKKWYGRRSKPLVNDDPLALWTADETPAKPSPVKGLWTRSTRNLFSTNDVTAGSSAEGSRRPSVATRLFSRSKLNLVSPDDAAPRTPRKLKRNSLALLKRASFLDLSGTARAQPAAAPSPVATPRSSRSSPNLLGMSALGSRSQPSLFPKQPARRGDRLSRESFARSETNLVGSSSGPAHVPPRGSSLSPMAVQAPFARPLGPPETVHEVDEEEDDDTFTPAPAPVSFPLRRTTTFGTDEDELAAPAAETPAAASLKRDATATTADTILATPPLEPNQVPTPGPRRLTRGASIMTRLKSAFKRSPSSTTSSRPPSSLSYASRSLRPASRMFTREEGIRAELVVSTAPDSPATSQHMPGAFPFPSQMEISGTHTHNPLGYHVSQSVVESMISLPLPPRSVAASPSSTVTSGTPRRQASWKGKGMRMSTDNLLKRLTKLAEDEGERGEGKRAPLASLPKTTRKLRRSASARGPVFPRPPAEASERPPWAYPASMSTSAFSAFAASTLSLDVDFGPPELGLDEIIDSPRRAAYIGSTPNLSTTLTPRMREAALASTAATLAGARAPGGHARGLSDEPHGATPHVARHARHMSVPINVDNLASSSSDSLASLPTGAAGAMFDFPLPPAARAPDVEVLGPASESQGAVARDGYGLLGVPIGTRGRTSIDSKRVSVGSSVSVDSFDADHVVETRAVRMTPRKATFVGFDTISPYLSPMAEVPTPPQLSPALAA